MSKAREYVIDQPHVNSCIYIHLYMYICINREYNVKSE